MRFQSKSCRCNVFASQRKSVKLLVCLSPLQPIRQTFRVILCMGATNYINQTYVKRNVFQEIKVVTQNFCIVDLHNFRMHFRRNRQFCE